VGPCSISLFSIITYQKKKMQRLAQAFSELSLMRKEVLRLLFVERMKPKEIAMLLRCSENYVNVQKKRALKELRQMLAEGGYADE